MFPIFLSKNKFNFALIIIFCVFVSIIVAQDKNIDAPDLFPRDVVCYFEIKDIQDIWKTAKNKTLSGISAEDAKKVDEEITKIFKQFTDSIKNELNFDIEKTFSEVDSIYFSLNSLSFNLEETQSTALDYSFDIELLIGLKSVSEGYFDSIFKSELKEHFKVVATSSNTTLYEIEIKESTIAAFQSIYILTFDKFAFASNKKASCEMVESRYKGNEKSASLKENNIYKKILLEAPSKNIFQLGWIDATKVWDILEKNLDRESYKIYQQIDAVLEFKALNNIIFYVTLDNDFFITNIKCDITKNGSEAYDIVRQEPASVDILNIISEKCLLLLNVRISDPKQIWQKIKKFISEKEQDLSEEETRSGSFNETIEDFESKLSILIEELLEPFDDEFAFAICGDSFQQAEENMLFIAEISNMQKFESVEKKILTESEWNKDELPTESEYKNFKIKSVKVEGNFFYTIVDKFLVISPNDNALKELIDNYINKKTIRNSENFKYAFYGLPEKVSKLFFYNAAEFFKLTIQGLSSEFTLEKIEEIFDKIMFKYLTVITIVEKENELVINSSSRIEDLYKSCGITLGVVFPAFQKYQQISLSYNCTNNMRDLYFQISYTQTLKRKFLTDLSEIEISPQSATHLNKETLTICPASKEKYIYIYPVDENRTPPNYILVYEKNPHIENYNVIYFDGTQSQLNKEDLIKQLKQQIEKQKPTLQRIIDKEKDIVKKKALENIKASYESIEDFIKK